MTDLDIKILSPENLLDPYPIYKQLRDEAPVYLDKDMNIYNVTRYDLLRDAINRTEDFSSQFDDFLNGAQQMMFATLPEDAQEEAAKINAQMLEIPPTMLTLDEPKHTQYRSLVKKLFTGSQIKKSESDVRQTVNKFADAMQGQSSIDFMDVFGFPVPLEVISARLGILNDDKAEFYKAAVAAASGLKMTPVPPEILMERLQLLLDLQKLLIRTIEFRRTEPAGDMITILATAKLEEEDRHLTHGEALSVLNQFLVAGHETTASTFGWGMLLLCRNPELQEQLRGDEKLIKTFVEEALRIESPIQGLPRVVTRDTTLGDYSLKAGDLIMLKFGAANRDERQFEGPDDVDINRAKPGRQMAFSAGVHHCIGAPLARQELNIGFYTLLEKFKNFRLDPDAAPPMAEPSLILRGLPHLQIQYEER